MSKITPEQYISVFWKIASKVADARRDTWLPDEELVRLIRKERNNRNYCPTSLNRALANNRLLPWIADICFNEELNLYVAKNKRKVQMKDGKKKTRVFYLIRKENEIRQTDIPGGKVASGFYKDAWDNNQSTNRSIQRKKKRKIAMVSIAPEQAIPTVSPTPNCIHINR